MTKPEAEQHAKIEAFERAQRFVDSAHLAEFGMSAEAMAMAVDLIAGMLMQSWHEGAIAAIDQAIDVNRGVLDKAQSAYDRLMAKVG